jgi:hypothetical protein
MFSFRGRKDRLIISAVIIISVAGILYFGYQAISENANRNQENPFQYDLEEFKKSDPSLDHYSEVGRILIELRNVSGVAIGPEDQIYVSGDDSVLLFDQDGILQSKISTAGTARCLTVDRNQNIYLGMEDHVEVYDREGENKANWPSLGDKAIITSIAVSKNSVFIADAGNKIVWKFDRSGNRLIRIGEKNKAKDIPGFIIPSPFFDVAIDPDGFLWVANTGRHSLENYTEDGGFRTSWGEFGIKIDRFCGCCNPSHFTILEDGSFVTSEKGLARVKVSNRLGELVSVVAGPDQFAWGTVGLDLAADSSQRIFVLDPFQRLVRIFEKKKT